MRQFKKNIVLGLFSLSISPAHAFLNAAEKSDLAIEVRNAHKSIIKCSKTMINCLVRIESCGASGSVTITNISSSITALNIQATSSNPNFATVIQSNNCTPSLPPGAQCSIGLSYCGPALFLVPNALVAGTNTTAAFFDLEVFGGT